MTSPTVYLNAEDSYNLVPFFAFENPIGRSLKANTRHLAGGTRVAKLPQ